MGGLHALPHLIRERVEKLVIAFPQLVKDVIKTNHVFLEAQQVIWFEGKFAGALPRLW